MIRRSSPGRLALVALVALTTAVASTPPARAGGDEREPLLQSGDRVVLYGDSITEQRLYTRFLEQYVYARRPDLNVRFWNAGWGGDTAAGARARLARDVLVLKPTLVTLFFGMNDGRYQGPDVAIREAFKKNLSLLVEDVLAAGARVVVFTPGCIDPDKKPGSGPYNDALEGLGKAAMEVAREHHCPAGDVFHPMLAVQNAMKAKDAKFTMIPDSVHPDAAGHLVVAAAMLDRLGIEPMPALGTFDVGAGKGDGLSAGKREAGEVALTATRSLPMPFWIDPASIAVAEACGILRERVGQRLQVRGLAAGAWDVEVDGSLAGTWSADDLGKGVVVAGTGSAAGKALHDALVKKENAYFAAWRETRLPLEGTEGLKSLVEGLDRADEGWHRYLLAQCAPRTGMSVVLRRAPVGSNLALHCPYEASDRNTFGWGKDGLTDGSWEGTAEHCFATGSASAFPKHVTVDLGKSSRVGGVRFGAPDFGSTRTVIVMTSRDGNAFSEVGRHVFSLRRAERATIVFPERSARFVRLVYQDHHDDQAGYPATFAFTTELEVFGT